MAALDVFYGHAVQHLHINESFKPFNVLAAFIPGVPVFFFLSGFFIWKSIERTPDFKAYVRKRMFRIFPELWMAITFELLSIIVLYNDKIDWLQFGLFAITQGTIFQFWTPSFLRGYGCGTPNGSLWTICVIIQFYLVIWFLYKKLKNKSVRVWICLLFACIACGAIRNIAGAAMPEIVDKLFAQTLIPYLWQFMFGCFVAEKFEILIVHLKKLWPLFLLLSILLTIEPSLDISLSNYGLMKSILFFGLCIGFGYSFPRINTKTDISYGLYIYHMIVINAMIALNFTGTVWCLVAALFVSGLAGYLSTIIIGRFGLRHKVKTT